MIGFEKAMELFMKGEKDSSGISIDDKKQYLPSKKILLTQEEYDKAHKRIEELDKHNPKYNLKMSNCMDFVSNLYDYIGKGGSVSDFMEVEQLEKLSSISDALKNKETLKKPNLMDEKEKLKYPLSKI